MYTLNGYDADKITGRVVSGDFDNDGYWDDIAAFYDYGNGETRIHVWLSTGSSFTYQYSTGWWNTSGYTATKVTDRVVSGDFDRDGNVDDIAAFYDYGGQIKIHVWLSTGSNFWYQGSNGWYASSPFWVYNAANISKRVISLNIDRKGENYDDIVAFFKEPYFGGTTSMHVFKSDGASFNKVSNVDHSPIADWGSNFYAESITGKIVDYDSRTSSLTQGKPSDIIGFHKMYGAEYCFWKAKKTNGAKIEYSKPSYCESKSTNEVVYDEVTINAYPNPTNSFTIIDIPKSLIDNTSRIEVHNLHGRLVLSDVVKSSSVKIDLSKQKPGVYMVKVIGRESNNVLKIVKD
jgi:hypothetical protein